VRCSKTFLGLVEAIGASPATLAASTSVDNDLSPILIITTALGVFYLLFLAFR
jgi:hypothetical protein